MSQAERILERLDKAQADGTKTEIGPQILSEVDIADAEKWLLKAKTLDSQARWLESANIYNSLYQKESDRGKRVRYGASLAQMFINASNLDKAGLLLEELEKTATGLEEESVSRKRALSAVFEKRAWVADCREQPDEEIRLLKQAGELIESITAEKRIKEDGDRLLTVQHFTGRALYKIAKEGKGTGKARKDLEAARDLFQQNLEGYRKLGDRPDAVAFNEAWLARVAMAQGKKEKAKRLVENARKHFEEAAETFDSQTILGHYHRVAGQLANYLGNSDEALEHGIEALRLTLPNSAYYNGVLEATKIIVEAAETATSHP